MMLSHTHLKWLDHLGAGFSLGCAVYCALQPFLIVLLPLLGLEFLLNRSLEMLVLGCSLLLALWAVLVGVRRHSHKWLFLPWGVGPA